MRTHGECTTYRWLALALLTSIIAVGCADLSAIQGYAQISTESAQYTKLVDQYVEYPSRLKQYGADYSSQEYKRKEAAREAQKKALLALHETVAEYMATLNALAGDDTVVYDKEIDALGKAITDAEFADKTQSEAASALAKLIAKAVTDGWRQKKLKELILAADENLQLVLGGLQTMMSAFNVDLDGEAGAIKSYYGTTKKQLSDPTAIVALEEWRIHHESENRERRAAVEAYSKILSAIGNGHKELVRNADDLDNKVLLQQMKRYKKDLKSLFNKVKKL